MTVNPSPHCRHSDLSYSTSDKGLPNLQFNYNSGKICKLTVFLCRTFRDITLLKVFDCNELGKICEITVFHSKTFNVNFCEFIVCSVCSVCFHLPPSVVYV